MLMLFQILIALGLGFIVMGIRFIHERFFIIGCVFLVVALVVFVLRFDEIKKEYMDISYLLTYWDECDEVCKKEGYDFGRILGEGLCECVNETTKIEVIE